MVNTSIDVFIFLLFGNNFYMRFISKNNYDYLIKPITALSLLSVLFYLFKLLGIKSDMYFALIGTVVILYFVLKFAKSKNQKFLWLFLCISFWLLYFIFFKDNIISLAAVIPKNLFLFSFINSVLNTFGIYDYENLMFFSSHGGATFINNALVCGFVNLARYNAQSQAALYLSSKAIFSFALLGILIAKALNDKVHAKEYFIFAVALLFTGNPTPALFLFFIMDKVNYYLSMCFVFFSCIAAQLADRALVFQANPSVFELFLHSSARAYLFALLIFIPSVSYYVSRLESERLK